MAAGDIYRVTIVFSNSDTTERVTMGVHGIQPGIPAPDIATIGPDVVDWWNIALGAGVAQKAKHHSNITLIDCRLRRIKPLEPAEFSYTTGLPIAGTDAANSLPPGVATVFSLRTAKIGRSYRGRVYLPPMTQSRITTGGDLIAADATNCDDQFTAFLNTLVVDNFVPAVYSRKLNSAETITSVRVDQRYRDQRRRTVRNPNYV